MARIAILHPGEMGAAIGDALVAIGHDVGWLPGGRAPATRLRADRAGLRPLDDVIGVDLVISVCPPGAAADVARSIPGYRGLFLDANAIAPVTAEAIAAEVARAGMAYVDGSIIGPPPAQAGSTRLYLSGTEAPAVAALFAGARIEARMISGAGPRAASGLKMAYAAWSKISSALLLAVDGAAARLGVGDALRAEWQLSQPDLTGALDRARAAAGAKGWRWTAEMQEIAAAFAAVDEPTGFALAAAGVFARFDRPGPVS
jgi:3-hydroxyisobutyrate dehydrogenase-like beta-hydroxyacid dehydrogenase